MTFNLDRSLAEFGNWVLPSFWKHQDDLDRYARVIEQTRPQVVIETGTNTGASARWFAMQDSVELVITIDIDGNRWDHRNDPTREWGATIDRVIGSSTDPTTILKARLGRLVNRRIMVSLDSDHSRKHVADEIAYYAPLVTSGCPLVIEDGIIAHLPPDVMLAHSCQIYTGNVLEAIDDQAVLLHDLGFDLDRDLEDMTPVTMHPNGWWRKA